MRLTRLLSSRVATIVFLASTIVAPAGAQIAVDKTEITFDKAASTPSVAIINLHNQGAARVQAVVRLEDWDRKPDGTNQWYQYATKPGSCGDVLNVFPLTVSLEPDAKQSIRVSVDSTKSVSRECWAAAIVETVQPRTVQGRNVSYVIRTATKIYVMPASGLSMRGSVNAFEVNPTAEGNEVQLEFQNSGAKHLKTSGKVQFRRPDNSVAATVDLPVMYTLPGASSTVKVAAPKLEAGRYIVLAVLDYGGDELAAGQVELEVSK